MFNGKHGKQQRRVNLGQDSAVTILTSGCHFNGKLYTRGSSRIGGKIEGEIISEGLLIIEESAIIKAKIKADEAVIQGQVNGQLEAHGRVELTSTSQVDGDIATPSLIIHEGAQFNGRSRMLVRTADSKQCSSSRDVSGVESIKVPDATPDPSQIVEKQPEVAMINVKEVSQTT